MSDTLPGVAASAPDLGKAYVISGFRRDTGRLTPSVGVYTVPDSPGMPKAPDRRMLEKMGFNRVESIEEVKLVGTPSAQPTLYVMERSPAAKFVLISQVAGDGSLSQTTQSPGQLHSMVPALSGSAVDRLITPRETPSAADLKKNVLPALKVGHRTEEERKRAKA
jgi:hypothetical protein